MSNRDKNGRFVKGKSPNPKGRPKGSRNRSTAELREAIEHLLSDNWEQLVDDLQALEPRERIAAMTKLLEYALPKLTRAEAEVTTTHFAGFADAPYPIGYSFLPTEETARVARRAKHDDDESIE